MPIHLATSSDLEALQQELQALRQRVDALEQASPPGDPVPTDPVPTDPAPHPFSPYVVDWDYGLDRIPTVHADLQAKDIGPIDFEAGLVGDAPTSPPPGYTVVTPADIATYLQPGAKLALSAGTYSPMALSHSGIELLGLPGSQILQPPAGESSRALRILADSCRLSYLAIQGGWYVCEVLANDVVIESCRIVGDGEGLSKEGIQVGAGDFRNIRIAFCDISEVHDGVSLQGHSNLTLEGSVIHHFYDDGVEFDKSNGDVTVSQCLMYAGGLSNISWQGSGPGPYYVRNNVLTGTRKRYTRLDGLEIPGAPWKVRANSLNFIEHNIVVGQNSGGYMNYWLHPEGRLERNIFTYNDTDGMMQNSSSDPLQHTIDYNCYDLPAGAILWKYVGMRSLEELRANGWELNGLLWPPA